MKDQVWRLLRRNISVAQLAGYALANLAGLFIILTGLQLYRDVTSGSADDDDLLATDDFIIISPQVSGLGLLSGGQNGFSHQDIAELKEQPWVKSVGEFKSAEFNVAAGVNFAGRGMSTQLFLESVPDEYVDLPLASWNYDPEKSREVPIIISKDYLALYNFGFAASRSLPRISESMVGMVPIQLYLSGNGRQDYIEGRIVGFSSRLNTIAVPESFIDWANDTFSSERSSEPSRLIVKVDNPGNPAIEKYMAAHGYDISGESGSAARAGYVMGIITSVVVGIGVVISLLSLVILLLSISLLMQKNREKISSLIMLGYSPYKVAGYYVKIVVAVNTLIFAISSIVLVIARSSWKPTLEEMGLAGTSPVVALTAGAAIMIDVTVIN
ncbi:MAG: ABC transporter permease, partial [Duncaniella sp.]|nr:ABC transporter permease [Duncaniella sp.]